ncbi:response regulator transcription factor [Egicoccus halophilus]|uniref:DNA-binding response regulator n=1 Tax=Egicoccus halophilus TaxID=1670830 RepID=A0A8J3EXN5_9ACTN|nr:response regulator transcription factor [Egicoccus halophilus]GGI06101.1 DNA-binding response regulator [Egicoccus halophilus]
MPTSTPRLLVVEDDDAIREVVSTTLRLEGYAVEALADGLTAHQAARAFRPDLAILDVRLPNGPSGLSVARLLREGSDLPILFLTAADSVDDRLAGFDAGGDDYLVKPFVMAELLARVNALLRRSGRLVSQTWQVGDLVVDEERRSVHRAGAAVALTTKEFDLLVALARHPDRVLSKVQLLASLWGFDAVDGNLVEVHVSSLRRKLEQHGPRVIQTVRGAGYRLRVPE